MVKNKVMEYIQKTWVVEMTEEERAEEYADKILSDSKYPFIFNKEKVKAYIIKVYLDSLKVCEESYKKGLAEGRKETESHLLENWCRNEDDYCPHLKQLEKEISVLLSCKTCPENKGGYICEKEYNDKCLAQKIEYIKELEAQIEKMKSDVQELSNNKYYYLSQHICKELLRRWN